jgi:hypothetical protein
MIDLVHAINWRSTFAQVLAMLFVGTALGLLWILNDLAYTQGFIGWIMFIVIVLPVYFLAAFLWEKVFFSGPGEKLASLTLSWRHVGIGLFVALGTLLITSGLYLFFLKALEGEKLPLALPD